MKESIRIVVFVGGVLAIIFAAAIVGNIDQIQNSANALPFEGTGIPLPGIGIKSLSLVNLLMAFAMSLMILEMVPAWRRTAPKVLGIATAVLAFFGFLASVFVVIRAFTLLFVMIGLLFSPPFGTIAYFSTWGSFPVDESRKILTAVMMLQLGGLLAALLSNPTLLKNIWLILLGATVVGITMLLGLLHALPPSFVVSIADVIGAIISGVVAAIWMILFFFSGVKSALKAAKNTATSLI